MFNFLDEEFTAKNSAAWSIQREWLVWPEYRLFLAVMFVSSELAKEESIIETRESLAHYCTSSRNNATSSTSNISDSVLGKRKLSRSSFMAAKTIMIGLGGASIANFLAESCPEVCLFILMFIEF